MEITAVEIVFRGIRDAILSKRITSLHFPVNNSVLFCNYVISFTRRLNESVLYKPEEQNNALRASSHFRDGIYLWLRLLSSKDCHLYRVAVFICHVC